jgi:hypothetical protein
MDRAGGGVEVHTYIQAKQAAQVLEGEKRLGVI